MKKIIAILAVLALGGCSTFNAAFHDFHLFGKAKETPSVVVDDGTTPVVKKHVEDPHSYVNTGYY